MKALLFELFFQSLCGVTEMQNDFHYQDDPAAYLPKTDCAVS
jgi:hypothetical protein